MHPLSRAFIVLTLSLSPTARAQTPTTPPAQSSATKTAFEDMRRTFGFVPDFLTKLEPEEAVPGAWQAMRDLELSPKTALPGRIKELIGVAVAAQIPCSYCSYFHTAAAKQNGASDRELREALAIAALTRQWSTFINGTGQDVSAYRAEYDRMSSMGRGGTGQGGSANTPPTAQPRPPLQPAPQGGASPQQPQLSVEPQTPDQALAEIQTLFGGVPSFIKTVPKASLPGFWSEYKAIQLNPNTALPAKHKSLISLAVSAQMSCAACVYSDRQAAAAAGASDQELGEAIGMGALTRHWSTLLNGSRYDMTRFQVDANKMLSSARRNANP